MNYRFELTALNYNGMDSHTRVIKTLAECIYQGKLILNRGASEVYIDDTKSDLHIVMDQGCKDSQYHVI